MDSKNKFSPTVLKIVKFRDKCQNFDVVENPPRHNISIDITIVELSIIIELTIVEFQHTCGYELYIIIRIVDYY